MKKLPNTILNDEYLAKCADDEPIFALCGRDRHASGAIRHWAISRKQAHGPDDEKAKKALEMADKLWDYYCKNVRDKK